MCVCMCVCVFCLLTLVINIVESNFFNISELWTKFETKMGEEALEGALHKIREGVRSPLPTMTILK